jgi:hypothetical protein
MPAGPPSAGVDIFDGAGFILPTVETGAVLE